MELKDRKPARSRASIPPNVLHYLNSGDLETANLVEGLALRFDILLRAAVPGVPDSLCESVRDNQLGITRRMQLVGEWLAQNQSTAELRQLRQHRSDTVRGWVAYALGGAKLSIQTLFQGIEPLANDPHFGVREWAWLGIRPRVIQQLPESLQILKKWARSPEMYVRRFSVELTRPCGVWCPHLVALKQDPTPAAPLLEANRADPAKYLQDSVSNWLSDAGKSQPDWVRSTLQRWREESPVPATQRIISRVEKRLGNQSTRSS